MIYFRVLASFSFVQELLTQILAVILHDDRFIDGFK